MALDQLEELTDDQLQTSIAALQEAIAPIQEKINTMQKVLEDRKREELEWDKLLSHPESQIFLKNLTEETKADIAAERTKQWNACREDLLHT
jgi:hypothetical protein